MMVSPVKDVKREIDSALFKLAGMTRTPYPLLDPIMVGPVLLCLNIHFPLLPDLLLLSLVAVSSTS